MSGMYYLKVYSISTNELIYSCGFATIFGEYRTTEPARQGIKKTFHQTLLLPFPKSSVLFVIEGRDVRHQNLLCPIFSTKINPKDVNIIQHTPCPEDRVFTLLENGHPHEKVDLVFMAEGYTEKSFNNQIKKIREKYQNLYQGKIGVFEGAGYSAKGLYRSEVHVGMFYNEEYGKVSEEALLRQILHLSR